MNARNGKIARLPRLVREALNERLEQSEESPELLGWLNALPEVKAVVETHFAGAPICKQNLSRWRKGGYQEWLVRRDLCGEARSAAEFSRELGGESAPRRLAHNVATVLTARLGGLISKWNGQVDKTFETKVRLLNGLCNSIVRLQRGTLEGGKTSPTDPTTNDGDTGNGNRAEKRG